MELRVLRYFIIVVQEENITRAAKMLHITQPALSRQLMDLEQELGTELFIRGKRKITLTDAGTLFYQRAKEIIELADKTKQEFGEAQNMTGGVISIGSAESIASQVLSDLMKVFSQKYPKVRFDLFYGNADEIREKLDKGLLDAGLLLEPVNLEKYAYIRLPYEERWGVLMRKEDPLARKEYVSLEEIKDLPLIIPKRLDWQNEIANWFGAAYDRVNVYATYNMLSGVENLVENDLGYLLCLQDVAKTRERNKMCFRPLVPERTASCVLVWKKNQMIHMAAARFLEVAKEIYGK
jgi:DNA-binding transcriptional LysR family regulator